MKASKLIPSWFNALSIYKLLFLAAFLLFVQAFLSDFYLRYQQVNSENNSQLTIETILIDSAEQQIVPLLQSDSHQEISNLLGKIIQQPKITKIGLFQTDGNLVHSEKKSGPIRSSLKKSRVKNLLHEEKKLGFLIIEFEDHSAESSISNSQKPLYLIALFLWSLLGIVIFISRLSIKRTTKENTVQPIKSISYKHELQQLLKRRQRAITNVDIQNNLVISANWESLKSKPKQPIIGLLNRWTAHIEGVIIEFNDDYLQLGLSQQVSSSQLHQLQSLELCLQKLGLKPTFFYSSINPTDTILTLIFSVLDHGIWLDTGNIKIENIETNSEMTSQGFLEFSKSIDIELEDKTTVLTQKLSPANSSIRGTLERQSRFYLE